MLLGRFSSGIERRPASGTLAEAYLQGRGITEPVPTSIRFLRTAAELVGRQVLSCHVSLVSEYR